MRFDSLRFRISVLYTSVLGIILVLYSGILYLSMAHTLNRDLEEDLKDRLERILSDLEKRIGTPAIENEVQLLLTLNKAMSEYEKNYHDYQMCITDSTGGIVIESANNTIRDFFFLKPQAASLKLERVRYTDHDSPEYKLKLASSELNLKRSSTYYFHLGSDRKGIVKILHREKILIVVDIALILLITSFIGQFFVSRILKPVKEIALASSRITQENLGNRIHSTHLDYEMQHLVDAINGMIERLENAFVHIAEFSLDVSHELKTPLSILRSEAEFALLKTRTPEEYQAVLKGNLDQIERMRKLTEDLLLLAKVDHETEVFKFEKLGLTVFLENLCSKEQLLAAEKNIRITFETSETEIFVNADSLHLRRLFINLISNAIKFTPPGGNIRVMLSRHGQQAMIDVEDSGSGIPENDLKRIFERFFRSGENNANSQPGSGLGLCIVQSIASVHGGSVSVRSIPGQGSTFTVFLPLYQS